MKNGFYLCGKVISFDEKKRWLLLEYPSEIQPSIKSKCPIFIPLSCAGLKCLDLKAGDIVCVAGGIAAHKERSTSRSLTPRLIAWEISHDDEQEGKNAEG